MPIVLLRVDERLIHGQVVVGWGERLDIERIVVVDDELSRSTWEQELYGLGVPDAVESEFVTVEKARATLPAWGADPERVVVLVRDVATLARLAEGGMLRDREVNLGGIHHATGRARLLPYIFLTPTEQEELREVEASGATISARDVPSSRPVPLRTLLDGS